MTRLTFTPFKHALSSHTLTHTTTTITTTEPFQWIHSAIQQTTQYLRILFFTERKRSRYKKQSKATASKKRHCAQIHRKPWDFAKESEREKKNSKECNVNFYLILLSFSYFTFFLFKFPRCVVMPSLECICREVFSLFLCRYYMNVYVSLAVFSPLRFFSSCVYF